jgi:hypothetical protein
LEFGYWSWQAGQSGSCTPECQTTCLVLLVIFQGSKFFKDYQGTLPYYKQHYQYREIFNK